ncbi:MAG: protein kinase [Bryobacterales bacterium]|nr:protein kinase [Bryobacterales bacterium]
MNERFAQVEELFESALQVPVEQRRLFVEREAVDDELRDEVLSLLEFAGSGGTRLQAAIGATATAAAAATVTGEQLGPYRITQELGRGGMGEVYLAERADGEFERRVAIKMIQGGLGGPRATSLFLQERQILATLEHPNIARMIDGGTSPAGTPYLVLEYIDGIPIQDYCSKHSLSIAERLKLFQKVCAAVVYAHQRLVIHRDIKPGNILVTADGEPKLLDFGIAKILDPSRNRGQTTQAGQSLLTPDYASPEQVAGQAPTTATDVYSLGAVLYQLLTGRAAHRFDTYSPQEVVEVICQQPIPAPQLGEDLDNILLMALRKEADRRYPSVRDMVEDIDRYLGNRPVHARPDSPGYRVRKFVRRNPWVAAAAAALVVASGLIAWQAQIARRNAARAELRFNQVRKLANTFLFEIDDKIKDVTGNTEARRLLVKTALDYLDSLSKDAAGDPTLRDEIASAYEKVGEVQSAPARANLGQLLPGLESLKKAAHLREELLKEQPNDPDRLLKTAITLYKFANAMRDSTEAPRLGRTVLRARDLAVRAAASRPTDPAPVQWHIRILVRYAYFLANSNDPKEDDIPILLDARKLAAAAVSRFGQNAFDEVTAQVEFNLGRSLIYAGRLADAERALQQAVAILHRRHATDPSNVVIGADLVHARTYLGAVLDSTTTINLGRPAEALRQFRAAYPLAEAQWKADPNDIFAKRIFAGILQEIGLLLAPTDPKEAIAHLERAVAFAKEYLATRPTSLSPMHEYAAAEQSLGVAYHAAGQHQAALRHLRLAFDNHAEVARQKPRMLNMRQILITTHIALARLYRSMGDPAAENREYQFALKIVEETIDPRKSPPFKTDSACELFLDLAVRAQAAGRTREAAEWLRKAQDYWKILEELKVSPEFLQRRRARAAALASRT